MRVGDLAMNTPHVHSNYLPTHNYITNNQLLKVFVSKPVIKLTWNWTREALLSSSLLQSYFGFNDYKKT